MKAIEHPYLIARSGDNVQQIVNTPKNVAAYICSRVADDFSLATPDNRLFLSSYGMFIDRCNDMSYYDKIKPELISQQLSRRTTKVELVQNIGTTQTRGR